MSEKLLKKYFNSPQEAAAQIAEVNPFFSDLYLPADETSRLKLESHNFKSKVAEIEPRLYSDKELSKTIGRLILHSVNTGTWSPTEGRNAVKIIDHATTEQLAWGEDFDSSRNKAIKNVEKYGFKNALEELRQTQDRIFQKPIQNYLETHEISNETEKILKNTIDIDTITNSERQKLSADFPSGNFLYHGAESKQLVKIFNSGYLANFKYLYENRNPEDSSIPKNNTGFEGISWSMNDIDALPGDRYHLAGFLAAPEKILNNDEQLCIPSRPAPNEVLQISGNIDANKFYEAKVQHELYRDFQLGETNSVFSNFVSIKIWENNQNSMFKSKPMLFESQKNGLLSTENYTEVLRENFEITDDGIIKLNPELSQQKNNEIPTAAVWLQAAIDSGRLIDSEFDGKNVNEIIKMLNGENINNIISFAAREMNLYKNYIDEQDNNIKSINTPIEKMYFVAARSDAEIWTKLINASGHKPAGMILYDDEKIHLENFASKHRGDHQLFSADIASILPEPTIDYSDVLGEKFNDSMRTGSRDHVINEKYLANRHTIKNSDGNLKIA